MQIVVNFTESLVRKYKENDIAQVMIYLKSLFYRNKKFLRYFKALIYTGKTQNDIYYEIENLILELEVELNINILKQTKSCASTIQKKSSYQDLM